MSVANCALSLSDITTTIVKEDNIWSGVNTFINDVLFLGDVIFETPNPVQFINGIKVIGDIDCSNNINVVGDIACGGNIICNELTTAQPLFINYTTIVPASNQVGFTSKISVSNTVFSIPVNYNNILCQFGINAGVWAISISNTYISASAGIFPLQIFNGTLQYFSNITFTANSQIVEYSSQCITLVNNPSSIISLLVELNTATVNLSTTGYFIITTTRLA